MMNTVKIEYPLLLGKTVCRRAAARSISPVLPRLLPRCRDLNRNHAQLLPAMPLAVGSKAPDFTLKTKTPEGLKDIKLSDNFGKKQTVLLFYPLAFTGTCTQEMCDMTTGLGQYTDLGAAVYGISVDSPFANDAWAKEHKIGITLLSDLNKATTKAYDVVFPNLAGIGDTSARAAFVIGQDGVVKYSEVTATPKDLPNFAAVKAALAK
jgi:peroxiredoxin